MSETNHEGCGSCVLPETEPKVESFDQANDLGGVLGEPEKKMSQEDYYSHMFKTYYPKYVAVVDTLTSAELKRLSSYLVGFPLEVSQEQIDFKTEKGTAAFAMAFQLMQAKFGLTIKALTDNMLLQQTGTEAVPTETNNEEVKDV